MTRAFITGANGFVGRYLTSHLEEHGYEVSGFDAVAGSGVQTLDITDASACVHSFSEAAGASEPPVIFHLAAVAHVGESWERPEHTWRVNTLGTVNVLAAAAAVHASRVLVVASSEVYGNVNAEACPLTEDQPLRPTSPYGASKAAADLAALQAFLGSGLNTIRVRSFNHTGPGQSPTFLIPGLAKRIAEAERAGATEIAMGNPDPIRDISDVRDVVAAYRLLAEAGHPGEAYHVCSGVGHRVGALAERLIAHSETINAIVEDPALVRPVDIPVLIGSNEKLRAHTGWAPRHTLDETLTRLLSAARSGN